jgi:hypothetical protein
MREWSVLANACAFDILINFLFLRRPAMNLKPILAAIVFTFSASAMAQTPPTPPGAPTGAAAKAGREVIKADREALKADREKLKADHEKMHADREKLRADRKAARAAKAGAAKAGAAKADK